MRTTTARFDIDERVANKSSGAMEIEPVGGTYIVRVRGTGSREVFEMRLADVANMVAYRCAKVAAEEKRAQRKGRRR
jgi:hypothetical protein